MWCKIPEQNNCTILYKEIRHYRFQMSYLCTCNYKLLFFMWVLYNDMLISSVSLQPVKLHSLITHNIITMRFVIVWAIISFCTPSGITNLVELPNKEIGLIKIFLTCCRMMDLLFWYNSYFLIHFSLST